MARYSARARQLRGQGKRSGPNFIQLFHYVKRSEEYHKLKTLGRALLIEIIDRYNGCNNGMIPLGAREAALRVGLQQVHRSQGYAGTGRFWLGENADTGRMERSLRH